jgi:hypothetical protein
MFTNLSKANNIKFPPKQPRGAVQTPMLHEGTAVTKLETMPKKEDAKYLKNSLHPFSSFGC